MRGVLCIHLSSAVKGAGSSVRREGGSSAASAIDVSGLSCAWLSPVVTGKPAGKRAHTTVCKISLASVSEFCEGGIVLGPPPQFFFLRARPSGGFSISGSLFPQRVDTRRT